MGTKCWIHIYVPHVRPWSEASKHVEDDPIQHVEEGMAADEDGIVRLAETEADEGEVQEVVRTSQADHDTILLGRVHSTIQIGNDPEPSARVHRDLHQEQYMRSMSPRSHRKITVSFLLMNSTDSCI